MQKYDTHNGMLPLKIQSEVASDIQPCLEKEITGVSMWSDFEKLKKVIERPSNVVKNYTIVLLDHTDY